MEGIKIRVNGKHINELSENIPSNIFALNELIKNAYDACASHCRITIDKEKEQVVIFDDGVGLGVGQINELFHISRSEKKFGSVKSCGEDERLVQGSKGLGFLSAFRFGEEVAWDTNHEGQRYRFSANKNEITSLNDIADYMVPVEVESSGDKGTTITINSNGPIIDGLVGYFSRPENHLKLVGAFTDPGFHIELSLPNKTVTTNEIPSLQAVDAEDQLFFVTYESGTGDLKFFRQGYLEHTAHYEIESRDYRLNLELMIYRLKSHGRKKISPYFIKPANSSITPLVFINDNLFNNYTMFDVDALRSKRSSSALPQIVGYVGIYSESDSFQFNSDRTNFVENDTTVRLKDDVRAINELVQETGSWLKSKITGAGGKITGPAYPKGGSGSFSNPLVRAKIVLNEHEAKFNVPSPQINLLGFVDSITNSNGESVPKSQIKVKVDGQPLSTGILESVDSPGNKAIRFEFTDPNTGNVFSKLELKFKEKKASLSGDDESKALFFVLGSDVDYCIQITSVATLMNEITQAHKLHPRYKHLVACSLRTIFELSTLAVSRKRPAVFKGGSAKSEEGVKGVVNFLKENNQVKNEVSSALGISYSSMSNSLDVEAFKTQYKKSHVGAHSGAQHLTSEDVEDIAKTAGYYAAFCDALINVVDVNLFPAS